MDRLTRDFLARGWLHFGADPAVAGWVARVAPLAVRLAGDPSLRARWLRCGGTWFAGVGVLPNAADGSVPEAGAGPLGGAAVAFIRDGLGLGPAAWDAGQISAVYPGYPRHGGDETEAAHRYRCRRDAAHVDGLTRHGPARRRHLGERHGFILGLPLTEADAGAAPLVVWEGSHEVIRAGLATALAGHPPECWPELDVTDAYHSARARAFATCPRVTLAARPGEATLLHRLALHGIAPWQPGADASPGGRVIAYFRPDCGLDPERWLNLP